MDFSCKNLSPFKVMYILSICTILWQGTQEFSNAAIKNQLLFCSCHLLASLDFWFFHRKIPWKPNLYFPLHPSIFHTLLPFLHHLSLLESQITKFLDTLGWSFSSLPVPLYPLWWEEEGYEEVTISVFEVQAHYRFLHLHSHSLFYIFLAP